MFGATSAQAYEIDNFSAQLLNGSTGPTGTFASQASDHPDFGVIRFDTKITPVNNAGVSPVTEQNGSTKTIRVDTPPGLVPNQEATPKCEDEDLEANTCAPATQIGMVELRLRTYIPPNAQAGLGFPQGAKGTVRVRIGLYNMETHEGELARFSFNPQQAPNATGEVVDIVGGMRPEDNGLFFTINNVSTPTAANPTTPLLTGSTLTFWGTPGSALHDAERGSATLTLVNTDNAGTWPGGGPFPSPPFPPMGTPIAAGPTNVPLGARPATGPLGITNRTSAFLTNPTTCVGPQTATLTLDSYQGDRRTRDDIVGEETNGLQGCDQVPFSSQTSFGPSSMQNDAPVPLSVALDIPQTEDTNVLGTSHVDDVSVTLPPGMTISPSAANGLEACTDAQLGQGTNDAIACPASSRVGAIRIATPVLDSPLEGNVYIGQPLSGNRYRLFLNADGHGISIRLKGTVTPNPETGQVTAVFENNPQLPFSQFKLDFDGGSKAIIASAQTCGAAEGSGTLTAYSGHPASRTASTVQTVGCNGNPFAPSVSAASVSTLAGKYSPIGVVFGRPDGNQFLSGLSATLPIGMTAKIKGVRQCSEAQVAAITCTNDSRIGTVSVAAGPGEAPYRLTGTAYLTGSYKGGAFGSVAVIRVIAGPYDLGHVVVRQALRVDPETAQVTVDSDPLPQIKEGIVLRLRELKLDVDRRDFLRNPTSCGPAIIEANLTGNAGGTATRGARQTFTDCKKLPFRPKITVAFGVKSQMKKGRNPSVTVTATQRESEAGIRSTQVALPKDVSLKAANAETLCTQVQMRADKCPKASIVGSARATTTILNRSLKGPVYFVKGERTTAAGKVVRTLPALYIPLFGEARINVRAQTSVSRGRLVTTLPAIPDAPITKFTLKINGGKRGIINANRDLCKRSVKASARFASWSGKKAPTRKPRISRSVCKTSSK
ncbi:hypothetical protein [Patulibacter americanus]|uniref:hypothetical protein n=1 Tax=Patulibacter americanus TaxID=588672 RepID=UPI0003B49082|nr:hypothetical protein [Patulibacter americanus]